MHPGGSESFLELSKSYNVDINELNNSVSYSWAARPVPHNLLHYSRERAEERKKEAVYFKVPYLTTLTGK